MAVEAAGLPFAEAIGFLQRKVNLPTRRSDDLRHGAHVRAFSVAGVTRDDMLADFREAMERARRAGTGYDAFRKDFDAIVERTGWQYYAPGDTEEKRRAWRAGIIYRTNMRTSYMAGRWEQMTDPDVLAYRPFWRYRHSGKERFRPLHRALDGKVFAADDPMWKVWYPPNGWGCGCDVEALSRRQLAALGKDGPDEKPDWMVPSEGNDPRTGDIEERWPGIDRGWEYNVGEAALDGHVPVELQTPLPPYAPPPPAQVPEQRGSLPEGTMPPTSAPPQLPDPLPPLPEPRPVDPGRLLPDDEPPETYADAFLEEFGATREKPALWRDPSGGVVTVSHRLFEQRGASGEIVGTKSDKYERGRYMRLLADTIKDPDEIWVDWAAVRSGVVLRRAYLKTVLLPDGRYLFLRFEWTSKGWIGVTAFPTKRGYADRQRRGALLFRRT